MCFTVLCKSNENEFWRISTKRFKNLRKWAIFRTKQIFFKFSKLLLFCRLRKIALIREKSGEISNTISQTVANFRNEIRRGLQNFEDCLKKCLKIWRLLGNIEVLVTWRSWLLHYSLLKCNLLMCSYAICNKDYTMRRVFLSTILW